MDDLVAIARIARPRGIRGELVAEVLTDFPERFEGLETVTVVIGEARRELKLEQAWFQNERIVLKFEGVDSIEAAEEFRDAELCVSESEAVELEDGEFFDWELEGCAAVTVGGETLGTVKELMRTGGTEVLVIEGDREYLVPFAESICTEVDIKNKRIVVDPPEGLLEF